MARRLSFIVCFCVLLPGLIVLPVRTQQPSLRVEFLDGSRPAGNISLLAKGGLRLLSANQFVSLLHLTIVDESSGTLAFSVDHGSVKLIAGNPFLLVTDSSGVPTAYQCTDDIEVQRLQFYVPLEQFLQVVSSRLSTHMELDSTGNVLRIGSAPSAPPLPVVESMTIDSKLNGMLIRVPLSPALVDIEHWVTPDGWLYLTIAGARGNIPLLNATKSRGLIKKVSAVQSEGSLQLSFHLTDNSLKEEVSRDQNSGDLIVTLRREEPDNPLQVDLTAKRDRWALDVIVIDPGHGGRDGGAVGVSGVREKDVTLGIGLKLGALIKREMKNVRVVYTRTGDQFVELDRRGTIANEAGGKLFISIHCNSMPRKPNPSRGFEVYLLRPGRTDEAVSIAERENAVITLEEGYQQKYKHLTDENFILVTMAQSAHVKSSEEFANILQHEMEDHAGIPNRGVKQAGFYVLVGASMPNVLVETAYLSNRQDEQFLKSERGQQKIAESIAAAVKSYAGEYERLLHEGIGEQ